MTLPVIIASTREALAAVPMSFREACWNVGATRWQTIRHVVLPNSISGILTGVILQVVARGRRDGARSCSPAPCSTRPSSAAHCCPTSSTTSAWRCRCTCSRSPPRCRTSRRRARIATALVLLGSVLLVNAGVDRACACCLRYAEAVVAHDGARTPRRRSRSKSCGSPTAHREAIHGISFDVKRERDPRRHRAGRSRARRRCCAA